MRAPFFSCLVVCEEPCVFMADCVFKLRIPCISKVNFNNVVVLLLTCLHIPYTCLNCGSRIPMLLVWSLADTLFQRPPAGVPGWWAHTCTHLGHGKLSPSHLLRCVGLRSSWALACHPATHFRCRISHEF